MTGEAYVPPPMWFVDGVGQAPIVVRREGVAYQRLIIKCGSLSLHLTHEEAGELAGQIRTALWEAGVE